MRCGNADSAAERRPPAGAQFRPRRQRFDTEKHQRIEAEGGDVAEKARERHERRGEHSEPTAPCFERQPRRRSDERDPDPEEVVEKAPQEDAIVEEEEGEQRP